MEREEILGCFNYKGNGKIYVKMGSKAPGFLCDL